MTEDRYNNIFDAFSGKRVAVIGDLIADEYLYCETSRVSREAPVLIVNYLDNKLGMGGALNVANNLIELGATVIPIGLIGDDHLGDTVYRTCEQRGMKTDGIIRRPGMNTIAKTRILACSLHTTMQQVLRIDRGEACENNSKTSLMISGRALELLDSVDAVILSDYGYGSISDHLLEQLQLSVKQKSLVVTADSRYSLNRFKALTALTPNVPEVQSLIGQRLEPTDKLLRSGWQLLDELSLECLLITRGKLGMILFQRGHKELFIPVHGSDEVADVTGAGDTVIATFTLACIAGASYEEAAILSNFAGGIVVMKRGAATVTPVELKKAAKTASM